MLREPLLWIANWLKNRKQRVELFGSFTEWIFHFQQWGPWGIDTDIGFIKHFHQGPGEKKRVCSEISKSKDNIKLFSVVRSHCQLAEGTSELRRKVMKQNRAVICQMKSNIKNSKAMHWGRLIRAAPQDAEFRITIQQLGKVSWSHPWQVSQVSNPVCSIKQNQQNAGHCLKRFFRQDRAHNFAAV